MDVIGYFCCGFQEGCGFECVYCGGDNRYVSNYTFGNGNSCEYDEIICKYCNKLNQVIQCEGCNKVNGLINNKQTNGGIVMNNQIELNLNKEGYKFITNFNINDSLEEIYNIAAKECEIDYKIINEAYDVYGNLLPDYKAFYVHKSHYNLSNFWRVYEAYDKRFEVNKK